MLARIVRTYVKARNMDSEISKILLGNRSANLPQKGWVKVDVDRPIMDMRPISAEVMFFEYIYNGIKG